MIETTEQIKQMYAANAKVSLVDDAGTCQCSGYVTDVFVYEGLTILAILDAEEPLAWAALYLGAARVRVYDMNCTIIVK